MLVSFNGYNENVLSFQSAASILGGTPVKITDNGTVAAAANGERFCGISTGTVANITGVQIGGYCKLKFTGTVTVGYQTLVADGNGAVKTGSGGQEALVVEKDTATSTIGIIL